MAPCVHPLINKYSHVLASYRKNGLSKYICADQHMTPQTTANLLLCCIWCQGKLLIEYLEKVTISEIIACCWESNSSHLVCSLSLYCLSHHDYTMWSQVKATAITIIFQWCLHQDGSSYDETFILILCPLIDILHCWIYSYAENSHWYRRDNVSAINCIGSWYKSKSTTPGSQ